jgi:hypothetical protein
VLIEDSDIQQSFERLCAILASHVSVRFAGDCLSEIAGSIVYFSTLSWPATDTKHLHDIYYRRCQIKSSDERRYIGCDDVLPKLSNAMDRPIECHSIVGRHCKYEILVSAGILIGILRLYLTIDRLESLKPMHIKRGSSEFPYSLFDKGKLCD